MANSDRASARGGRAYRWWGCARGPPSVRVVAGVMSSFLPGLAGRVRGRCGRSAPSARRPVRPRCDPTLIAVGVRATDKRGGQTLVDPELHAPCVARRARTGRLAGAFQGAAGRPRRGLSPGGSVQTSISSQPGESKLRHPHTKSAVPSERGRHQHKRVRASRETAVRPTSRSIMLYCP